MRSRQCRIKNSITTITGKVPFSTAQADSFQMVLYRSRTSSAGRVDDSESGGPRFESRHGHLKKKKSACAVGQGTLPKVVLDNDHLLSLDYEYGNGALEYVKHS